MVLQSSAKGQVIVEGIGLKIGRKHLHLNGNSRVCNEHFVKFTRRRLQIDEYPTTKLPKLPTMVNPPLKRTFPKKDCVKPIYNLLPDDFVDDAGTRLDGIDIGST